MVTAINTDTVTASKPFRLTVFARLRVGLILALAVFAGISIVQIAAIERVKMRGEPDGAPAWYAGYSASLKAERFQERGQFGEAGQAALQAIAAKPGDVVAIRTLALVAENKGQVERAWGLMAISARWGWRDTPTQYWLFRNLALAGQYDPAMLHGEALAARGQLQDQIFPVFAALASESRATPALVTSLGRGKIWRDSFYGYLRRAPPGTHAGLARLMARLQKSAAPPDRKDVAPLLEAMLDSGHVREARELWSTLFWKQHRPAPAITAGNFENLPAEPAHGAAPIAFEWEFDPAAEIYVVADPADESNKVLYVANSGSGQGPLAKQSLAIAPGRWVLNFRVRYAQPEALFRIRIGLRCHETGQWLSDRAASQSQALVWQKLELPVQISSQCRSQDLTIEPVGTQPGDPVDIWLDDFEVRSLS